jgi:leucyl/phenylalanyl-tRNA--protein transferase
MTELTPELLLRAYACGLFPMAERRDDARLHWIDPEWRGVIPLERFHVPKRLARRIRKGGFDLRTDTAFHDVMVACAEKTSARRETWINDTILALYRKLHEMGKAHSVECWLEDRLVGGLYGVSLRGAFFGESMFSRATDASKVALVHLVERLKRGGFVLLDTQFITPHLEQFGAIEVERSEYQKLLGEALAVEGRFYSDPDPGSDSNGDPLRQSSTQIS